MEISEVILFYSKFSRESVPCVKFIQANRMPVIIIGLDSPEARQKAMTGQTFQIKNVPTLVVSYTNGETQLYVGSPKIMGWFQKILNKDDGGNKREKKTSSRFDDDSEEENNSDEENSEEETVIEPPKKSKLKSSSLEKQSESKKHVKKSKKKRKDNKVELIMDYDENSGNNNGNNNVNNSSNNKKSQKLNTQISGLSTSRPSEKSSNSNVMNMARQMEMERDRTLGYKDEK